MKAHPHASEHSQAEDDSTRHQGVGRVNSKLSTEVLDHRGFAYDRDKG